MGKLNEPEASSLIPVAPADRPLLYALIVAHAAVVAALPVAIAYLLKLLAVRRYHGPLGPLAILAALGVEVGLVWRMVRIWRRTRARPAPDHSP